MSKFINIREQCFFGSLILVVITLSLPKYSLNSQSIIICAICWLFYTPFQQKWVNLKRNFLPFLLVSSLFWISLIGLLYSENIVDGVKNFQKQLPFLVFPLIFFSVEISGKMKLALLKYFSYGIIVSATFALLKAVYFKLNNFGNYFFYDKLGELLDIHTTYFAMYVLLALLYFINSIFQKPLKKNLMYGLCVIFLLWFLYLLSVRVSIVALLVSSLILIFGNRKYLQGKTILLWLGGVSLIMLFYFTPNFQKRFNAQTPEGVAISDFDTRTVHWQSALEVIAQNNLFFGAGTGDGHLKLYDQYLKNGFETGYIYQYNAHNQFLETALYFGLFGLLLLIGIIFIVFKKCYLTRLYLGVSIILVQIIFMTTESTLESQSGIVLFCFSVSLLVSIKNIKNKLVVIGPYPPPIGGISLFMQKFNKFFKQTFQESIAIINEFGANEDNTIYNLDSKSKFQYFIRLLGYLVLKNDFKYIYYNGTHGYTRIFLILFSKILNYEVILHFHGRSVINFRENSWINKVMTDFTLRNAIRLIAVNKSIINELHKINPQLIIIELPAYLTEKEIKPSQSISDFLESISSDKKYYITYGTLDKSSNNKYNYGFEDLIEVFSSEKIKERNLALILVLILYKDEHFSEYEKNLKPLIEQNSENIKVFINKGNEPLIPFFKSVEGYIRYTYEDGLGVSLYEALNSGILAIATSVCKRPEGVIVIDPNRKEELIELLCGNLVAYKKLEKGYEEEYEKLLLDLGFNLKN